MRRSKYVLGTILFIAILLVTGCSTITDLFGGSNSVVIKDDPNKFIDPNKLPPVEGTYLNIYLDSSIVVTLKDGSFFQKMLDDEVSGAPETTALTNPLCRILVGKDKYRLYNNGIQKGDKFYLIPPDLIQDNLGFVLYQGRAIYQFTGKTEELTFQDNGQSYPLDGNQMRLLKEQIKRAIPFLPSIPRAKASALIPYPNVVMKIDDNVYLTFWARDTLMITLQSHVVGYLELPDETLFNQLKAKYPQAFARTGLFAYQTATVTSQIGTFHVSGSSLDRDMRILLGSQSVATPNELPDNPITFEPKANPLDRIKVYENDYWLQDGKYFYKKGVYKDMVDTLLAG